MSVMVLNHESIDLAFHTVIDLAYCAPVELRGGHTEAMMIRERFFEKGPSNSLPYLARYCAIFNLRNFNVQYRHNPDLVEFGPSGYRLTRGAGFIGKAVTQDRICQTIKTLQCLQYNICDNYTQSPLFERLVDLIALLKELALQNTAEMVKAKWQ